MSTTRGWNYTLMGTTEDKRASKVAVRPPASYELLNVDGSTEGPCRPFPGFKEIFQFPTFGGSGFGVEHDWSSEVVEFFPFQITIGATGYSYGFVYRLRRRSAATGDDACDVYVDYWDSTDPVGGWVRGVQLLEGVPLPPWMADDGRLMSVSAYGKYLYVFVEGESAVAMYFEEVESLPGTFNRVVTTPLGPGRRPKLTDPAKAGTLGSTTPPYGARAGIGQVVLLAYTPEETSLMTGTYPSGSDSGSGVPAGRQSSEDLNYLEPGDYAFAYQLYDSRSGRWSALSDVAQARAADFDPDGSGALSTTSLYAAIEVSYDSDRYNQMYVYRSVKVQDAGGTYVAGILHLDKIIDLDDYLTVNSGSGSFVGSYDQSIYYYELEDKQLVYQETFDDLVTFDQEVPKAGASIWYEGVMLLGAIRDTSPSTDEENRRDDKLRGLSDIRYSSLLYNSGELFPPGNRYVPSQAATPVVSFVQAGPHVIGFSRDKQYHFRKSGTYLKPEEMHDGFGVTGPHALDTVGSSVYFVTTKGIKTVDAMGQLEDVRAFNETIIERWQDDLGAVSVAYDPQVSALFVLNPVRYEGCVLWFNSAMSSSLDDVRFLQVARGVWPSAVTYDADAFRISANDPSITGWDSPLLQRAMFLEKAPRTEVDDAVTDSTWRQRIFVVDYGREKLQVSGTGALESRFSMLPFTGDSIFLVKTAFHSTNPNLELKMTDASYTGMHILNKDVWGCKVYVVWSATSSLIGQSAWINYRVSSAGTVELGEGGDNLEGLAVGDVVAISPVKMRWVGCPLSAAEEAAGTPDDPNNYFQGRAVQAITCAFSDVRGFHTESGHSAEARFTGLLYRGSTSTPTARAFTRANTNERARALYDDETPCVAGFSESTTEGRHGLLGLSVTPGFEIICPDIDYRVVAVKVSGRLVDTGSSKRRS